MAAKKVITPEMIELLKRAGSHNYEVAVAAQRELAVALTLPLKQGVMNGDITSNIFEEIEFQPGASTEFPLDFLSPGTEGRFIAYTIPNVGRIPEKRVEGDYLMVPTYEVGASIDWALKYARDARWDIVTRATRVLEGMFIRKNNNDAFNTLVAAGKGRNLIPYDDAATAGLFTKRLVEIMKTTMRRNAGGNSTSVNQGKLTDLYMSPEAHGDIYSWDLTQLDDQSRNKVFNSPNGLSSINGVNLHSIDELGVGQQFQLYYAALGGTMPASKPEIVIGLDLSSNDSFVRPLRERVSIFEEPNFHRQRRAGLYAWAEGGWGVLDSRRILLGAC